MSSAGNASDIMFRGVDGTECEEFIAAIEDLAFTEGWSRDRERMLLFARSRLRHKALRWFAKLDPSKKNDWDFFVEALFDRYPLVETPAVAEISTPVWSTTTFSPGASTVTIPSNQDLELQQDERQLAGGEPHHPVAPISRQYDPSILGRHLGVLRIAVEDGTTSPQYIWRGRHPMSFISNGYTQHISEDLLGTTVDRHEALVVCFIPLQNPHLIGCLNATRITGNVSLHGNYELYVSSRTGGTRWNVLPDGTLQAWLSRDVKASEVLVGTSNPCSISFTQPEPTSNPPVNPSQFKARIVFEPI